MQSSFKIPYWVEWTVLFVAASIVVIVLGVVIALVRKNAHRKGR